MVVDDEPHEDGHVAPVATIFLVGRECPWRCVMCDLWQQTIAEDTPAGAIPHQIAAARLALRKRADVIATLKIYNAGSFFDPRAVPEADYDAVAAELTGLGRVIVESHPALIGPRAARFMDALGRQAAAGGTPPRLEVAMGLETVHPEALDRLNKHMTVDDFVRAAERLRTLGVTIRVFLLISPPFIPAADQDEWLLRSVETAFAHGASAVSLIPVRSGNGAVEALTERGDFQRPTLADIERSVERARTSGRPTGRLFVDLWDLERFAECPHCLEARRFRLHTMNLQQRILPPVPCAYCGGSSPS